MTDIVNIGFQVDTSKIKEGVKNLNQLESSAENTEKTINKSTKSIGLFGRQMGQASIQVQQLIGQVQGGTSPLVALSQQLPDLGIVLGAALPAAIAGVSASLLAMFSPALLKSTSSTKDLADAQARLSEILDISDNGTITLTNSIKGLSEANEQAAKVKLAAGIASANAAMKASSEIINESISDFDGWTYAASDMSRELDNLEKKAGSSGDAQAEYLDTWGDTYSGVIMEIADLNDYVGKLRDEFGLSTAQAIKLARGMTKFDESAEATKRLSDAITSVGEETGYSNEKLAKFSAKILETISDMEEGRASVDLLKKALGDLGNTADTQATKSIESLTEKLNILNVRVNEGATAAAIYAAQVAAGVDANSEQGRQIAELVGKISAQNEALKAKAEAEREAKKEAKKRAREDEKALESYEKQTKSLKDLTEQIGMTSSQMLVYRQVQKSISRGDSAAQTEAIRKQAQSYVELRDAWEAYTDDLEASESSYGKWLESISTTTTKIEDLRQEIEKTQQAVAAGDITPQIGAEYINDLKTQIESLEINPFESMTNGAKDALQSMSGMFESGSKDAKKLAVAMQALNLVQAVGAVLNQGNGDPYTAFGRMAAMAGMVASLGVSIGNLSGSDSDTSQANQENQNLNTWGEHAESIMTATEETADATSELVGINTDMLDALNNLAIALASASDVIAKNIDLPTANASIYGNLFKDSTLGSLISKPLEIMNDLNFGFLSDITSGIFNAIGSWLGGSSSVTDEGIKIIGGSLSDMIEDTTVLGFQSIKYKKWKFGKSKTKTVFADLGDEVGQQFSLVFDQIANTVATGAETLGFKNEEIQAALDEFQIQTESLSLKGLDAEAQAEVIQNYFSSIFNDLAQSVVPIVSDFQHVGEELGETLSRLATEVNVAEYLIDNFGVTFADKMTDNVAFITAADNLATLAGGAKELAEQVASFTDSFASDEKKFEIYQKAMTDALNEAGLYLPDSAEGMYDLMSSLDATTEAGQAQIAALLKLTGTASEYYDLLEQRQEDAAAAAEEAESKIQAVVDENLGLVSQIAQLIGDENYIRERQLESLDESSRGLQEYIYAIQDTTQAVSDAKDSMSDTLSLLSRSIDAQKDSVKSTYEQMVEDIESETDKAKDKVSDIKDLISSLSSAFDTVSDSITTVTISSRKQSQSILNSQLAIARSGGDVDADAVTRALDTISEPSEDLYSDFVSYARDQAIAANTINDLLGATDDQLTDSQKQLNTLNSQLEVAEAWYDEEIDKLDKLYDSYEKQYNALVGVDDSVLSVRDATIEFKKSMEAYMQAEAARQAAIDQVSDTTSDNAKLSDQLALIGEKTLDTLSSIESNIRRLRLLEEGLTVA